MSLESLGDYLKDSSKRPLQRIYQAHLLEKKILEIWHEVVKVTWSGLILTIHCQNPSQAQVFHLRRRRLYALVGDQLGVKARLTIRIKTN